MSLLGQINAEMHSDKGEKKTHSQSGVSTMHACVCVYMSVS